MSNLVKIKLEFVLDLESNPPLGLFSILDLVENGVSSLPLEEAFSILPGAKCNMSVVKQKKV